MNEEDTLPNASLLVGTLIGDGKDQLIMLFDYANYATVRLHAGRRGIRRGNKHKARLHSPNNILALPHSRAFILCDDHCENLLFAGASDNDIELVEIRGLAPLLRPSSPCVLESSHETISNRKSTHKYRATFTICVCDTGHHRIRLFKIGLLSGEHTKETDIVVWDDQIIAGDGKQGLRDGHGSKSQFKYPESVCRLSDSTLLVADTGNNVIRSISLQYEGEKLKSASVRTLSAGSSSVPGFADGRLTEALFRHPTAMCMDHEGVIFLCDTGNHSIRTIHPSIDPPKEGSIVGGFSVVTTIAGGGSTQEYNSGEGIRGLAGYTDGTGNLALFNEPRAITILSDSSILVGDRKNGALRRLAFSNSAVVTPKSRKLKAKTLEALAKESTFTTPINRRHIFVTTWNTQSGNVIPRGYRNGPIETSQFRDPISFAQVQVEPPSHSPFRWRDSTEGSSVELLIVVDRGNFVIRCCFPVSGLRIGDPLLNILTRSVSGKLLLTCLEKELQAREKPEESSRPLSAIITEELDSVATPSVDMDTEVSYDHRGRNAALTGRERFATLISPEMTPPLRTRSHNPLRTMHYHH